MYFGNYGLRKTCLDKCLKSPVLEDLWRDNMVNGPKQWFNLNGSSFTIFTDYCEGGSWKKSLIVICKVLRLFIKRPTTNDKFSLLNRDNLMQPIEMDLSQEQETFSQLLCAFFRSTSIFKDFQKKMTLIAYVSSNLRTPKDVVR